ncbi:hypothetical protein BD769DRAFT_1549382 [Suillus cothurnatus]|nr:hypothetical protein BD769DRAFT_1549382 [Suillus cothurnatus]
MARLVESRTRLNWRAQLSAWQSTGLIYALLFDYRFIEVRPVPTSLLAQIILGNEIWDGCGTCAPPLTGSESFQQMSPNPRIHCVMAALEPIQHGAVGRLCSLARSVRT